MYRKFRTQPWYLFRYMLVWALVLGSLTTLWWSPPQGAAAGWLLALVIVMIISTRFDALLAALIPALALSPEPGTTLLWMVVLRDAPSSNPRSWCANTSRLALPQRDSATVAEIGHGWHCE